MTTDNMKTVAHKFAQMSCIWTWRIDLPSTIDNLTAICEPIV
jgi:hypothetical protein